MLGVSDLFALESIPDTGLASLGSGSRGNGTVISCGGVRVLVDCGFSLRQSTLRLARLGLQGSDLAAILVTHEHSDHANGVRALARKYGLPVYVSHGTARGVRDLSGVERRTINAHETFQIEDLTVQPVAVPHDAREPTQFVFSDRRCRIGVLTDLGHITSHVIESYSGCDGLLLEANHDLTMLRTGSYPEHLKRRVGGKLGHLSNDQTVVLLDAVKHSGLREVVIGHISEQNNAPPCLADAFDDLAKDLNSFRYATQGAGTGWISLD